MTKMTQEEKDSFDKLYQYIKEEIFAYKDQSLPKYMVLRLKGLAEGKFIANSNVKPMGKYTYQQILFTFKINKLKIKEIINSSSFKNEEHKFNTIMLIIEKDINDVVTRLNQKIQSERKLESIDLENVTHEGAGYKNKNDGKQLNDELNDLW
ncbi:MAG: hypothetical protein LLF98_02860 [Clostridium sp.]|uniref:hypothetical protein n=1 Tax=Clostridium sp. TaxID=1506 RepID=UPI0025C69879|nr:hypothetical protein [Clostridium sp.]MCE5220225.1 hypothetical protein [Clostridium sp.]